MCTGTHSRVGSATTFGVSYIPLDMRSRGTFRAVAVPLVMLALLLTATAVSGFWHHHDCASNRNCLACQVVHQTVGPAQPSLRFSTQALVLWNHAPEEFLFHSLLVRRQTPSRSPPLV